MRDGSGHGPLIAAAIAFGLSIGSPAAAQNEAATTEAERPQALPADTSAAAAPGGGGETRYTLVEVGGRALPVETEKERRCREEVTAGTLTLRQDGRWLLETTKRETCGDRTETEQETEDGRYRSEGGTIRFLDDDGRDDSDGFDLGDDDLDIDDLETGRLGDGGTLTVQVEDDDTELLFRQTP
ncbi:MAG TPA: hypothetical protein VFZ26_07005 [Gemmatimonadales bacterium]